MKYQTDFIIIIQIYHRDIAGSIPDHCNKVGSIIKQVDIFLLVEGLAFKFVIKHIGEAQ